MVEARAADEKAKERQKLYKDDKCYVKPHCIKVGDTIDNDYD